MEWTGRHRNGEEGETTCPANDSVIAKSLLTNVREITICMVFTKHGGWNKWEAVSLLGNSERPKKGYRSIAIFDSIHCLVAAVLAEKATRPFLLLNCISL